MPLRKQPSVRVSSCCSRRGTQCEPPRTTWMCGSGESWCNDQWPLRGAVALQIAGWGGACGAGPMGRGRRGLRHPDHAQRSVGRAAAGRERSGPRAPCGAAGRRGSERYWAQSLAPASAGNPPGALIGTLGRGAAGRGALLSGRLAPGALDVARVGKCLPCKLFRSPGQGQFPLWFGALLVPRGLRALCAAFRAQDSLTCLGH